MSLDRSLKGKDTLKRHRNVLTRAERVDHLKELGVWTDDSTVLGMPKVSHRKVTVKKSKAEKKTDETEEAASTEVSKK